MTAARLSSSKVIILLRYRAELWRADAETPACRHRFGRDEFSSFSRKTMQHQTTVSAHQTRRQEEKARKQEAKFPPRCCLTSTLTRVLLRLYLSPEPALRVI